ncbi:MAG: hypothetical protein R3199_03355 [Gemmatimonadota bacterium]|nr:hypothetical protein [Gemmatimonadota bacterium]
MERSILRFHSGRGPAGSRRPPDSLFELLVEPGRIDPDALFWGGEALLEEPAAEHLALGWHRRGGPIVLVLVQGPASARSLLAALETAARVEGWKIGRWDDALTKYWEGVDTEVRARIAGRWGLPMGGEWTAGRWASAVWGEGIEPGRVRIGILARSVPVRLRRGIEWLASERRVAAAWERDPDSELARRGFARVAGRWGAGEPSASPGDPGGEAAAKATGPPGSEPTLEALVGVAEGVGARVVRRGQEWVRLSGPGGDVRCFPAPDGVDVQLVGANEGTLLGLRFRTGVEWGKRVPGDAPPGVHLRVRRPAALEGSVGRTVAGWLSGTVSVDRAGRGPAAGSPDR